MLILESFFITLGLTLVIVSYMVFVKFTYMPNVRPPKRLSLKVPEETFQFYLARDSSSGLLHLSPCPPTHPLYGQALKALYDMPELTYDQIRYLRDLQYTFELAMSAYIVSCSNDETIRLSAKFMEDMYLLASEMYAIARRLNLAMQVRFPRECDDPILTSNQLKENPLKIVKKAGKDGKKIVSGPSSVEADMDEFNELTNPSEFHTKSRAEELFDFKGILINEGSYYIDDDDDYFDGDDDKK